MALSIRFVQTWFSSLPYASICGRSGAYSRCTVTPLLELAAQDDQRVVQALVDVHGLDGRLVQIGVGLQRLDDLGDAPGALTDLLQQASR